MPGQRRSAAGIVPQQLLQIEEEQYKQGGLSDTYVWPVHHRATLRHDEFSDMEIPVIDLSCLQTGDPTAMNALVCEIRAACLEWGFFQVINHGGSLRAYLRCRSRLLISFLCPWRRRTKLRKDRESPQAMVLRRLVTRSGDRKGFSSLMILVWTTFLAHYGLKETTQILRKCSRNPESFKLVAGELSN